MRHQRIGSDTKAISPSLHRPPQPWARLRHRQGSLPKPCTNLGHDPRQLSTLLQNIHKNSRAKAYVPVLLARTRSNRFKFLTSSTVNQARGFESRTITGTGSVVLAGSSALHNATAHAVPRPYPFGSVYPSIKAQTTYTSVHAPGVNMSQPDDTSLRPGALIESCLASSLQVSSSVTSVLHLGGVNDGSSGNQ